MLVTLDDQETKWEGLLGRFPGNISDEKTFPYAQPSSLSMVVTMYL